MSDGEKTATHNEGTIRLVEGTEPPARRPSPPPDDTFGANTPALVARGKVGGDSSPTQQTPTSAPTSPKK